MVSPSPPQAFPGAAAPTDPTTDVQPRRPSVQERLARALVAAIAVLLVAWADVLTGVEIAVSIFYLVPVAWLTWHTGRRLGLMIAFMGSVAWYSAERMGGQPYSHDLIPVWNAAVRLGFFSAVVETLHRLREALFEARIFARKDPLTGLNNSRAFREAAAGELSRARRYGGPISLVYLDIDNFKQVNDDLGHQVGDTVLQEVGNVLRHKLRRVDCPARLGGDEFAVLLPHSDAAAAAAAMQKVRLELGRRAKQKGWPITFSVGIATFTNPAESVDEMIRRADQLMYTVKHGGKNNVLAQTFPGSSA